MFLVNSRLGLFSAAIMLHRTASFMAPLLPKLRGHFAEFLNNNSSARLRILSSPTCVGLRYGHLFLDRGFSWQCGISYFATYFSLPITPQDYEKRICLSHLPTYLDALFQQCAQLILLRHPISQTLLGGTGISTCCPSPTPFGLGLGPDLP